MRHYLTPVRIALISKTSAGEVVENKEPSFITSGDVDWYSHCGKQHGGSSKT